jgi:hypothetical protein
MLDLIKKLRQALSLWADVEQVSAPPWKQILVYAYTIGTGLLAIFQNNVLAAMIGAPIAGFFLLLVFDRLSPKKAAAIVPSVSIKKAKLPALVPETRAPLVKVPEVIEHPERIILAESPTNLIRQYSQRTTIQSEKFFKSVYYGKWVVWQVSEIDVSIELETVYVGCYFGEERSCVLACFDGQWEHHLSHLEKGTQIRVCGQLKRVDHSTVVLEKCELA